MSRVAATLEHPEIAGPADVSVLIPASNESGYLQHCLNALLASDPIDVKAEIIVISNGSEDDTFSIAKGFADKALARGWELQALDLSEPGKINALNEGDRVASGAMRIYLDADVAVSKPLLGQLIKEMQEPSPVYTSGRVQLSASTSIASRAYGRIYQNVPFLKTGVPGCGLFAVNAAGRKFWPEFPDIISDDTYVRLLFSPDQRKLVPADYEWPLVEGVQKLIRVRRRQDLGVIELKRLYPEIFENDDKPAFGLGRFVRLSVRHPFGMFVYGFVALVVRLNPYKQANSWSRGR